MDAKPKHPGNIRRIRRQRIGNQIIKRQQEQMGEGRPEGGSVHGASAAGGVMSRSSIADRRGLVGALAFGTEYFDGVDADFVA
jgi:hypothetical protein